MNFFLPKRYRSYIFGYNTFVILTKNKGALNSKGEYIAFIDSDDMVAPNYISRILEEIEKGFDYCYISWKWRSGEVIIDEEAPKWNTCVWNCVYNKSLIRNRRFDCNKNIGEDEEFNKVRGGKRRNITDIGTSEPLIDWRRLLKEAVKYDIDWSYQNAGIENGVVTAYLEEIPRPETEIVLDTSGSIDETLLRNFLRECKNILQTSKVKVGCFDTQFYGFTEIKDVS